MTSTLATGNARTAQQYQALQNALNHVTLHPAEWDQSSWGKRLGAFTDDEKSQGGVVTLRASCGTVACLAGTGVLQNGYSMIAASGLVAQHCAPVDEVPAILEKLRERQRNGFYLSTYSAAEVEGSTARDVSEVAAEMFGLSQLEAELLFDSGNTLIDLWTMAYVVAGVDLPSFVPDVNGVPGAAGYEAVYAAVESNLDDRVWEAEDNYDTTDHPNEYLYSYTSEMGLNVWAAARERLRSERAIAEHTW